MSIQLCGSIGGNTGGIPCAVSPESALNFAIWGGKLTPEQYATSAGIKTKLVADSKLTKLSSDKLFLLPLRLGVESKKEANVEQSFSNGLKVVAREGLPGYRFSFKTSQQQNAQLRKFNNQEVSLLVQDKKLNVWGTVDENNNFIGRRAILFFEGLDHPGDDTVAGIGYVTVMFLDPIENYDTLYFVAAGFNFQTNLKKLFEVQLFEKAAASSNVLKVSGKIETANPAAPIDIYSDYSTTLFNTGSLWKATNVQTGGSFTITGIASNAGGYGALTLDSTAFAALSSGDKILIENTSPTALDAAGAAGIETTGFIFTKP